MLSKETFKEYLDRLKELEFLSDLVVNISKKVYTLDQTREVNRLSFLLITNVAVSGVSLLKLLPRSKQYRLYEAQGVWDLFSLCNISRSIIDRVCMLIYFNEPGIDKNEINLKIDIFKFHSENERLKLLDKLKNSNMERIKELKQLIEKQREKISNNHIFNSLNEKIKIQILKGRKSVLKNNSQLVASINIRKSYYEMIYKYFSQYVHSLGFSMSQMSLFSLHNNDSIDLFTQSILYSSSFICFGLKFFIDKFPEIKSILTFDESTFYDLHEFFKSLSESACK